MHDPDHTGTFRDIELELLCALVNDVNMHSKELKSVTEKFELEDIKKKVGECLLS